MAYQDIDRRRDGTIGFPNVTGSFDQNAVPYQYSGEYTSETRVQFPFESQWIQISALTSDAVKFASLMMEPVAAIVAELAVIHLLQSCT